MFIDRKNVHPVQKRGGVGEAEAETQSPPPERGAVAAVVTIVMVEKA